MALSLVAVLISGLGVAIPVAARTVVIEQYGSGRVSSGTCWETESHLGAT